MTNLIKGLLFVAVDISQSLLECASPKHSTHTITKSDVFSSMIELPVQLVIPVHRAPVLTFLCLLLSKEPKNINMTIGSNRTVLITSINYLNYSNEDTDLMGMQSHLYLYSSFTTSCN